MKNSVTSKALIQTDRCHRCGGLMVPEQVFEIRSIDFRCVSCGERVDPVILAHRRSDFEGGDAEKVYAGKGKARLS
jgi:hypothetical protein